jgi:hypothetical protein
MHVLHGTYVLETVARPNHGMYRSGSTHSTRVQTFHVPHLPRWIAKVCGVQVEAGLGLVLRRSYCKPGVRLWLGWLLDAIGSVTASKAASKEHLHIYTFSWCSFTS